jgi:hypothetical protein
MVHDFRCLESPGADSKSKICRWGCFVKNNTRKAECLNIVELDLVKGHFCERFGDEFNDVVVIHDLIDIAFIVGA